MLTREEIQLLIVMRIGLLGSAGHFLRVRLWSQIEILTAVLNGGRRITFASTEEVLKEIEVPFTNNNDGTFDILQDWYLSRGCALRDDWWFNDKLDAWDRQI